MPPKTRVGVDTPQMEAFRELMRAQDALARRLDHELQRERNLSINEYLVLLALRYAPESSLPVGDLSRHVHMTKSGVTRLVDRMEAAGTVQRVADREDRRSVRATITQRGREDLRKAWPVHRRGIDLHFAAHLSASEAETLSALLRRIVPEGD